MMSVNPQGRSSLAYRVKRWTAFDWDPDDRTDREPTVAKAAALFEKTLRERYTKLDCQVRLVRVAGRPQLVFEATIYAMTEVDAKRQAVYRFEKALQTRVRDGGRMVQLRPPWGRVEAERLDG